MSLAAQLCNCLQCLLYKNVSTLDYRARAPRDVWHSPWDGAAVGITQVWLACSPSSLGISPLWTGCTAWTGESRGTAPGVCGPSLESSALLCNCPRSPDPIQWAGPPICNKAQTWQRECPASCSAVCCRVNAVYWLRSFESWIHGFKSYSGNECTRFSCISIVLYV